MYFGLFGFWEVMIIQIVVDYKYVIFSEITIL